MNGIEIKVESNEVILQTTFNNDGFAELFEESEVEVNNVYTQDNETVK